MKLNPSKFFLRVFSVLFFLCLTSLAFSCTHKISDDIFELQEGTVIELVSTEKATELMTTRDEYINMLSPFDLQSKSKSDGPATTEEYLDILKDRAVDWTDDDRAKMKNIVASVSEKLKALGLELNLPPVIEVIKTDMKEEDGASAYTRQNFIVFAQELFSLSESDIEATFIHELFHILSRNNPDMSEKIYNTIGFVKCDPVAYPPEIESMRITNPDAPFNNYYIDLKSKEGEDIQGMFVLFGSKPYEGGAFMRYLDLGIMVIEGEGENKKPVYKDGKPLILGIYDVSGFYEKVGRNSNYIIHPEELSADHFVLLLNQAKGIPDPQIIDAMLEVLKSKN